MPHHIEKKNVILAGMCRLDIFSELIEQKEGHYEHELDLDVILYGRGYTGGRVGPYVRLLVYKADEKLICEGDWRAQRPSETSRRSKPSSTGSDLAEASEDGWDGNSFYILVKGRLKFEFKGEKPVERSDPGRIFGAMRLLEGGRAPATVSIPKGARATVLEFKRPAIRLLRKYPKFSQAFDQRYHEYGLNSALRDVHKAGGQPEQWAEITEQARFEVFDKNHVLFRVDRPITHIFLIKKGWVEVMQALTDGLAVAGSKDDGRQQSVRYLGPGNCFGLEAISDHSATWKYTATLLARTELLTVPVEALRGQTGLADTVRRVFSEFSPADEDALSAAEPENIVAAKRSEITSGLVDGTNLLVMDMDKCVRCGNCSMACHHVHGQSRLVRRGIQIERPRTPDAERLRHVLAPNVCLHCQDPECLTGCPTGAISRFPGGQIDINPQTCIGCGDCATQCPYNAITLVSKKDAKREAEVKKKLAEKKIKWAGSKKKRWAVLSRSARLSKSWRRLKAWGTLFYRWSSIKPAEMELEPPPAPPGPESLVAIKCNLCQGKPINPRWARRPAYSCEENCPTGALVRVNPREYFSEIKNVIGTIYTDQTHAIGRNIHRRDWPARFWHAGGILATLAVVTATVWAAYRYGLHTPLPGTTWTLRWLTSFVGLFSICVALSYSLRKQIYRWRCGPLRYWLLAHVYFGVIGAIVLLIHGGWHSGSLLTSALMVSFDLVILSGLFGLACYKLAPRIMTRIEGTPLLIEDLRARRAELHETLRQFDKGDLHPLIEPHVRRRFFTLRYLWRQFLRREPLTVLEARARGEFGKKADELGLDQTTRARLIAAVETAAMTRRVEALIYLHRLLKLWVAPHVAFTVLMLVLLAAHLAQVFFFAVR